MTILTIISILYAVILMLFVKKNIKGFNPAAFFTFFWALQICIILLGWSNYLYFRYTGIIYILTAITCFDVGYLITQQNKIANRESEITIAYNLKYCKKVYVAILIIAIIGIFYNMIRNGFSISSLFSLESFLEMSNENSVNRYNGEAATRTILNNVFDINGYACPLIGGLSYHLFTGKEKIYSFFSFFPSILDGFVQGAKMGIITGIIMWIIGYIIVSQLFGVQIKLRFRHIVWIIIGVFSFFLLLFATMMFRYGELSTDTFNIITGKIISYSLGHLPAFDIWYDGITDDMSNYTFGGRTFNGITNPLGILKREGGIFEEPVDIDGTNVFTVFRFFIEDFGVIGSLLYLFIMGCVCGSIYIHYQMKRNVVLNVTLLSMIYFFIAWSFVASIFAYTTYLALIVYIYIILFFFFKSSGKVSIVEAHGKV